MSLVVYVLKPGVSGGSTNVNGVQYDIGAAIAAGGGSITVDDQASPALVDALDRSGTVVRSGGTATAPVSADAIGPVIAHQRPASTGDVLVRGNDGIFAPSQSLPPAQLPASVVLDASVSPKDIDSTGVADTNVLAYNAASGKFKPASAGGGGSGLPANVLAKIANYTAAAGDFVDADASGGTFTVTLPTTPAVGSLVTVKKVDGTATAVAVAGTVDGDAAGASITSPQFGAVFEYVGAAGWKVTAVTASGGSNGTNGTNGNTIWNGAGAPTVGTGVNGDFYIDTTAHAIYGPKAAGAWGSGTSLVGPTGAAGSNGTNGAISTVQVAEVAQTVRAALDFVAGANVTVTGTDDAANGRTKVTIAASGGGGGSGTYLDNKALAQNIADITLASAQWNPTAGTMYLMKMLLPANVTSSKCLMLCTTQGTTLANSFIGVYDHTGAQLAATADISASLLAAGVITPSWVGGATSMTTPWVYVALLIGSGSTPKFTSPPAPIATFVTNANLAAADGYRMASYGTGLSALPASVTLASAVSPVSSGFNAPFYVAFLT